MEKTQCPNCLAELEVPRQYIGKETLCEKCQAVFVAEKFGRSSRKSAGGVTIKTAASPPPVPKVPAAVSQIGGNLTVSSPVSPSGPGFLTFIAAVFISLGGLAAFFSFLAYIGGNESLPIGIAFLSGVSAIISGSAIYCFGQIFKAVAMSEQRLRNIEVLLVELAKK